MKLDMSSYLCYNSISKIRLTGTLTMWYSEMETTMLNKGDVVDVYNQTLSGKRILEGKAKLLRRWADDKAHRQEYWEVQFLSDKFVADRWINLPIKTKKP